ncbi:uncharacterized protein LY89DRAFT_777284 [Mollisia scopiformis]|uniref:Uncharacterized protein n=1 Tax=Mollisia scopiformis TaxID=149040 RepID=A0A194XTB2_MOLSC|nr:uncharacterized protein LY89DRAFT_777284 [Mollisia scopiformis]KUJ23555.1 hypothetical protein LY89DRAFT_777284 [Mollisia scopiformis]
MTSSSRNAGDREHGNGTTKKQQQQSKVQANSKDKLRHHANATNPPMHECECMTTNNHKVPHRRKSARHVPHTYTPFHHLSLDAMDGLPDANIHEFGNDPEHDDHEDIGDESTTILTPSYDTNSTIPTYFDEDDECTSLFNTLSPYARTTHDLRYIGHWVETQEESNYVLPSYVDAISIGRRYSSRVDVRDAMVGIEVAFPSGAYETVHRNR